MPTVLLNPDRLAAHLQGGALLPLYLIAGDEPLQQAEAADRVRAACERAGYDERRALGGGSGFDWATLAAAGNTLSLFAERRLLELRLVAKPDREGGRALQAYAAAPPADTVLLISSPRIDRQSQSSAWFKALEATGAVVQVWPVERRRFPGWLKQRAATLELRLSEGAARLLAERVENNMLAAAQELEKLRLIHGPGPVDEAAVLQAVADSARYNVFDLSEAMLGGDAARARRILCGLREEGVEPVLILWALSRELRALALAAGALAGGAREDEALRLAGVWAQRKIAFTHALRRELDWRRLLCEAAGADRAIKGLGGAPWDALEWLALRAAGAALPAPRAPAVV